MKYSVLSSQNRLIVYCQQILTEVWNDPYSFNDCGISFKYNKKELVQDRPWNFNISWQQNIGSILNRFKEPILKMGLQEKYHSFLLPQVPSCKPLLRILICLTQSEQLKPPSPRFKTALICIFFTILNCNSANQTNPIIIAWMYRDQREFLKAILFLSLETTKK